MDYMIARIATLGGFAVGCWFGYWFGRWTELQIRREELEARLKQR